VAATPGQPGPSRRTSQSAWDPLDGADLRLRRRVRTKTQVQAEALALFAEKGYSQTSVQDIADAAAISPRTFYRYFTSKEDVVLWDAYDELPPAQMLDAHPGEDPFSFMVRRMRTVVEELYEHDREPFLLRVQLSYRVPEIRAQFVNRLLDRLQPYYTQLEASLDRSLDDVHVAVPLAAAFAAMLVAVERWQRHDGTESLPQLVDDAFSALGHLAPNL
jgi:AcrR family transcriptional regulator